MSTALGVCSQHNGYMTSFQLPNKGANDRAQAGPPPFVLVEAANTDVNHVGVHLHKMIQLLLHALVIFQGNFPTSVAGEKSRQVYFFPLICGEGILLLKESR